MNEINHTDSFFDVILAVGYRANSRRATEFRRWVTTILKEYIYKGFALDDERLKSFDKFRINAKYYYGIFIYSQAC